MCILAYVSIKVCYIWVNFNIYKNVQEINSRIFLGFISIVIITEPFLQQMTVIFLKCYTTVQVMLDKTT